MELNYLEEFTVLANRLNFTKTADELHLAQSTLSKHMSLLEADLSAQLFRRVHSQVELTEEGFFFLGVAAGIVNEYRNAQSTLKTMVARKPISIAARMEDPAISGLLSVAASLAAPDEAPITFSHAKDKPPLDLIVKGDLDVLVDLLPARGALLPSSIARRFLFSQPFVAIMDPANPLAEHDSLSIADLKDSALVQMIWENIQPGWEKIVELCHQNGFEPKVRPLAVRSQAEAIAVLPQGSVLLYPAASRELRYLDFAVNRVLVPITDERAVFSTYAIYREDRFDKLSRFFAHLDEAAVKMGFKEE